MGGSSKTKQKQVNSVPDWVERGSQRALGMANDIASQPYTPYTGERIAGLSQNEQMGVDLARTSSGKWMGDLDTARGLLGRTTERFTDADINAYMNPYLEGALNPAARKVRESAAMERNRLQGMQTSQGAFGGGRSAALQQALYDSTGESVSDLYGRGYFEAFERGADRWAQDMDRSRQAASDYVSLAQNTMNMSTQDINNLMSTGGVQRGIEQMRKDFDYQQFVEGRDWDMRGLDALLTTLDGIKGSYTTTSTSETKNKPSALGQAVGLAATIYGFSTGGLGTALMQGAKSIFGGGAPNVEGTKADPWSIDMGG